MYFSLCKIYDKHKEVPSVKYSSEDHFEDTF